MVSCLHAPAGWTTAGRGNTDPCQIRVPFRKTHTVLLLPCVKSLSRVGTGVKGYFQHALSGRTAVLVQVSEAWMVSGRDIFAKRSGPGCRQPRLLGERSPMPGPAWRRLSVVEPPVRGRGPSFHFLETAAEVVGVFEADPVGHFLDQEILPGEQALGQADPFHGDVV